MAKYWEERYYPQPTEATLRKNAASTAQKAKRKGQALSPVIISGRKIAKSWCMGRCESRVDSLEHLLSGSFPEELKDLFLGEGGLFPAPREIAFGCSCPDWAVMCKHVAAVLYGIGTKLDENPFLFFELRGIDVNKLVDVTIKDHVDSLLEHANMPPTDRVMDDSCIETLFGLK